MARTIEFYRTRAGKCPVEEFLDRIDSKEVQKVLWVLRLIERVERVPRKYFQKLTDSEEIWECRVLTHKGLYRLFAFFATGDLLILTHGYVKQSRKTDPEEIDRAERYRQEYLSRK
jgi:phage-related protein